MRRARGSPWLICAVLLVGCKRPVDEAELPGAYVRRPAIAADTLWLERGGRYRRVFVAEGTPRATATGAWSVEREGARWALALASPDTVSADARMLPLPQRIRPMRGWRPGDRRIRLPIDETTGAVYQQVAPR